MNMYYVNTYVIMCIYIYRYVTMCIWKESKVKTSNRWVNPPCWKKHLQPHFECIRKFRMQSSKVKLSCDPSFAWANVTKILVVKRIHRGTPLSKTMHLGDVSDVNVSHCCWVCDCLQMPSLLMRFCVRKASCLTLFSHWDQRTMQQVGENELPKPQ